MKFTTPIIIGLTCLLVCTHVFAAGKVYKWTDKDGVTHFGATPPLNTQTEIIKPQTGHSDPVTYATPTSTPASAANTASSADDKAAYKDKTRCEQAHKNQETLKTYTHIKVKGADGEYRFLTPDEQKQKLDEADKAIKESCD